MVMIENFIDAIIQKSRHFNAYHALNYTSKTYKVMTCDTSRFKNFKNNIDMLKGYHNPYDMAGVPSSIIKIQKKIKNELKTFDNWFYKKDHEIIKLYNEYVLYKKYINSERFRFIRMFNLYDIENQIIVEEMLDIKIDYIKMDYFKLKNKYDLRWFFTDNYSNFRWYDDIYNFKILIEDINTINKIDYIEENFNEFSKFIYNDNEEDENDSSINQHDHIEESF